MDDQDDPRSTQYRDKPHLDSKNNFKYADQARSSFVEEEEPRDSKMTWMDRSENHRLRADKESMLRRDDDGHGREEGVRRASRSDSLLYSRQHGGAEEGDASRHEKRGHSRRKHEGHSSRSSRHHVESTSGRHHRRQGGAYEAGDRHHQKYINSDDKDTHRHHASGVPVERHGQRSPHSSRDHAKEYTNRPEDGDRSKVYDRNTRHDKDPDQHPRQRDKKSGRNGRESDEHSHHRSYSRVDEQDTRHIAPLPPTFHEERQPSTGSYSHRDIDMKQDDIASKERSRSHSHRGHRPRSESHRGRSASKISSSSDSSRSDTSDGTPRRGSSSRHRSAHVSSRHRSRSRSPSGSRSRSRERSRERHHSSSKRSSGGRHKDKSDKGKRKRRDRSDSPGRKRRKHKQRERDGERDAEKGRKKDEERRSVLTGKKIKLKVKQDKDDIAREKNRMDLLQFLNSTLG